jgi:hypothetical protein
VFEEEKNSGICYFNPNVITCDKYSSLGFRMVPYVEFFNLPNASSRTMALGSTQPLTEMSTSNLPGGKGCPARKADNLTAICESIF